MNPRLVVVDASAALGWVFGEEFPDARDRPLLESAELMAPPLWGQEVCNAVLVKQRRGVIDAETADDAIIELEKLAIRSVQPKLMSDLKGLIELGRRHQLSAYDATYLALAMEHAAQLCTNDRNLRQAASREGLQLLPLA